MLLPPIPASVNPFTLLRLLADGQVWPEQDLALQLGCPVTAIRLLGDALLQMGVVLTSTGSESNPRAIRLERPIDLIDRAELEHRLVGPVREFQVEVLDECGSTNALLGERARSGAAHGSVIVCEHQTAGKGRRGNAWASAPGCSLTFSLLWQFSRPSSELQGLSLAVAVACAKALERHGAHRLRLKWPNDLIIEERKLGGILVESLLRDAGEIGRAHV